jgi:ParB-like chromosome segregation protein Spo0J
VATPQQDVSGNGPANSRTIVISQAASYPLREHPYASLFPLVQGSDFNDLVEDVRQHGVREPIALHHRPILDGRNRYRAAQAAGVPCLTRVCKGYDPAAFVVSANIHRRHLTEQRRGLIATLLKADPTKSNRQVAKIAGQPSVRCEGA